MCRVKQTNLLFIIHPLSTKHPIAMAAQQPTKDILDTIIGSRYMEFENRVYAAVADEAGMVQDWSDLEREMVCPKVLRKDEILKIFGDRHLGCGA